MMYLRPEATMTTLRTIAAGRAGTTLVVEFLLDAGSLGPLGHSARDAAAATAAADGEPVMAAYTREEVAGLLAEAGFGGADLFGAGRLRDRYLRGRPDLPLHAATVIAIATV